MRRPSHRILALLAGLLLTAHGVYALRGFTRAWSVSAASWIGPAELTQGVLALVLVALIGRIVLAWLPAGPQGSHLARHLPVTWALSHVLGLIVVHVERIVLPKGEGPAYALLLSAPWIALLVLRWITLPAAMVPRHEPRTERGGTTSFALNTLSFCWAIALLVLNARSPGVWEEEFIIPDDAYTSLLAPFGLAGASWLSLQTVGWFALWILVGHGLAQARRAPTGRAFFVALGVLAIRPYFYVEVQPAIAFGSGAVFLVGWIRRADRRACCLSATGFSACVAAGEPTLALAGLATLVLVSWSPQRRFALMAAGVAGTLLGIACFVALRVHLWFRGWFPWSPAHAHLYELFGTACDPRLWGVAWYLFAGTVAAVATTRIRPPRSDEAIVEPLRERLAILLLFVLGCLALFPLVWVWSSQQILVHLFPVSVLLGGLVWVRPESGTYSHVSQGAQRCPERDGGESWE